MLSLSRKRWLEPPAEEPAAAALVAALGVSPVLARLLARRGLQDPDQARFFLQADTEKLHDPFLMRGMDTAVERLVRAIESGEKFAVYGDYDVDGVTAAALMVHFFRELDCPISWYLPDRLEEGYGVNTEGLRRLHAAGHTLVITADCGITAVSEVAAAREWGLDVIITDHHQVGPEGLPQALAVLNPHQPDCRYPYRFLSGVGIVFKLAAGVRRRLYEKGWDPARLPNLKQHLDLFALGTIADLAPLTGENHVLSVHGLEVMRTSKKPGLVALKNVAGCTGSIDAFAIGFGLGPRLNAAGRMGKADRGLHLLLAEHPEEALRLAKELDAVNTERRETQNWVLEEAEYLLEREVDLEEERVIVLGSKNFHPGVIGIVASKLVEKYHRPTVLIALDNGTGKGSARSIPAFNLHRALGECAEHLLQFGGHACAAGLTIEAGRVDSLRAALNAVGRRVLKDEDLVPEIAIDAALELGDLDWEFYGEVRRLEPFGPLNPAPVFLTRGVQAGKRRVIGKDGTHIRFTASSGRARVEVIGFRLAPLFDGLPEEAPLDIVYQLHRNDFSGPAKLELKLLDARPAL